MKTHILLFEFTHWDDDRYNREKYILSFGDKDFLIKKADRAKKFFRRINKLHASLEVYEKYLEEKFDMQVCFGSYANAEFYVLEIDIIEKPCFIFDGKIYLHENKCIHL